MYWKANVFVFSLVLLFDQFTKFLCRSNFQLGESKPIIPGCFNLTFIFNPGAAFGLFGGLPDFWRRLLLCLVSTVALGVVLWFIVKEAKGDRYSQLALSAILGGAVGNIVDRIRFDAVVDFLDFYIGHYHWPAFNVADSAISIGVTVLILRFLLQKKPQGPVETEALPSS